VTVFALSGTPAPESLSPGVLGHPMRGARTRGRWVAGSALTALAATLGAYFLWQSVEGPELAPPATPAAKVVAVLPFEVRGGEELAYLREGLVDLFSVKLDLGPAIGAVDPHALLSFVARNGGDDLDPAIGRRAAHFPITSCSGAWSSWPASSISRRRCTRRPPTHPRPASPSKVRETT
jgi:hypothetical protein